MALSATFVANFTSLFSEIQKAEVKFTELGVNSQRVGDQVQRLGERFSGRKMIDDAAMAARAIEDIGGAAILTDAEARRVNRQMSESYEKVTRVVEQLRDKNIDVDASLLQQQDTFRKLRDETERHKDTTEKASGATSIFRESFGRLTAAFSAANIIDRVITAIASFATEAVNSAGHLVDLREKTGLSLTTLQQMQGVADQTGVSLDSLANASYMLSLRLSSNRQALKELGLSYDALRQMSPDEQFDKVTRALEAYEGPVSKAELGTQLFGRSFKEVKQAVINGYSEMADAVNLATDAQLNAIERAGDRYAKFKRDVATTFQQFIGNYLMERDELSRLTADQQAHYQALLRGGADAGAYLRQLANERIAKEEQAQNVEKKRVTDTRDFIVELDRETAAMRNLTPQTLAQIEAARKLGVDQDELASRFGISTTALGLLKTEHKEASRETNQHAEAIKRLRDELSGAGTIEKVRLLEAAFKSLTPEQQRNTTIVGETLAQYEKLRAEVGTKVAPALEALFVATGTLKNEFGLLDPATGRVKDQFLQLAPAIEDSGEALQNIARGFEADGTLITRSIEETGKTTAEAKRETEAWARAHGAVLMPALKGSVDSIRDNAEKTVDWRGTLDNLVRSFEQVASIGGSSLQNLARWLGTVLASSKLADEGGKALRASFDGLRNGTQNAGAALINMAAGAMSVVSAMDQATASGNTLERTMGGVNAGFAAGNAILPGLGGAIGAVAGGLVGLIRGLTSVSEETKKVRGEIASFEENLRKNLTTTQAAEAAGRGWAATTIAVRDAYVLTGRSAAEAEAIVKQLWDDKNPNAARAAIEQINKVMEEAKRIAAELDAELNGALKEAVELGIQLPEELAGAIDQLVEMGRITGDNASLFAQLTAQTEPNFKAMEEAAKKFGVELSALGPAFAQNQLNQQAQGIIDAFETMKRGGADVGGVIVGMSDEINKFVQDTLRAGGTVPENMRPILEAMLAQGLLTDENGQKLEDLSGINFGPPIESAFDKIIRKLQELIDRIADPYGYNQMERNARNASDAVIDYFDRGIVPAVERAEAAVDGFNFGHSPGGLKEIPILARAASQAIQNFEGVTRDSMGAAEGSLNNLLNGIRTMGSSGLSRIRVDRDADAATKKIQEEFEGFIDPKLSLLSESDALKRIIRVAEFYGQQINESTAMQVLTAYGYKGKGRVLKGRLDEYLQQVSERWMEEATVGFASGTLGRTGSWFKNFGAGTPTVLHGEEAVVRRDQAGAFAAAFGGSGDGTAEEIAGLRADVVALPHHIARAVRDALLVAG